MPTVARRRRVLKAAGGLAGLALAGGSARVLSGHSTSGARTGGLVLETHETSDLASAEIPVTRVGLRSTTAGWRRSEQIATSSYTMAAFIWAASSEESPTFRLRTRQDAEWSPWSRVPPLHEAPDDAREAQSDHTGSDLVWTGRADAVQYEVSGALPAGLRLVLLHPRARRSDMRVVAPPAFRGPTADALRPSIHPRPDWGADETWRTDAPVYNHVLKQVHIHHTANANDYSRDEVPALVRGIYRYHTHYLGWSDIGYNFLVDRFGGIWEGRAGGAESLVRGAHTRGFNSTSTGIAVIGNFDQAVPSAAVLRSLAHVAAWKLDANGGRPRGSVRVRSEGSDIYDVDEVALLRVVDGHRDTNETSCPGRHLYLALPQVRRKAAKLLRGAVPVAVVEPASVSGTPTVGSALALQAGSYDPPDVELTMEWLRNGVAIPGATTASYVVAAEDFGAMLAARVQATSGGREAAVQVTPPLGPVTAIPTAAVRASGGRRRAEVAVSVRVPPGVAASPSGTVDVRVGGQHRVARLIDGRAVARFSKLRPGRRRVSMTYAGSEGLVPVTVVDVVTVTR